jgi:hypothetical protein
MVAFFAGLAAGFLAFGFAAFFSAAGFFAPKLKIEKNQISKKIYMLTSTTPLQIRM